MTTAEHSKTAAARRSPSAARADAASGGPARPDGTRSGGPSDADDDRLRVRRFDADRRDRQISLRQALASSPSERQLLWIDVAGDIDRGQLELIGKRFELDAQTRAALEEPVERPHLEIHSSYFDLGVAAEPGGSSDPSPTWLNIVASETVVITRHESRLRLLDELDERIKSDATLGAVGGAEFVELLLDAVVTSYFTAVDEIEDAIDELDGTSLRDDGGHDGLGDLVRLRRRIARLRRLVTSHRSVFPALTGTDIRQAVKSDEAVSDLQVVASRYEAAVEAVETSREALLGSFDVYMTRAAQRTNDVVKVLTITTVLLLPGSVIAGFLGMNVQVPLDKDSPLSFWIAVGAFALLALVVLLAARLRRWI
jgi:Mg2+ and Co2+ transporter CorA